MAGRDELEAQRIAALYKRLVLLGKARLPLAAGRRLVGPDCAYHLCFRSANRESTSVAWPAGKRAQTPAGRRRKRR